MPALSVERFVPAQANRWTRTTRLFSFRAATVRKLGLLLFLALAIVAAVQRGILTPQHATYRVFQRSFPHLVEGRDLYAPYPAEQGVEDRDRFKYNPSASLMFAPLSAMPFFLGVLCWTLLNTLALYAAMRLLIPDSRLGWGLMIVFPALIAAVQSTSSNGLIAALMIWAFIGIESGSRWKGGVALVAGTLMKLFPAALLALLVTSRERRRLAVATVSAGSLALVAPLIVTPLSTLAAQYQSWIAVLSSDEGDLTFARSIMVVIREMSGRGTVNWVFQLGATTILLLPLARSKDVCRTDAFRRAFFASLMVYVVIFNHQSENASYVIASVGLAVWFLSSAITAPRVALLVACMAGLEAAPYFLVWLSMQFELLDGARLLAPARRMLALAGQPERVPPLAEGVEA
jgi:hypothetical protein